MDCKLIVDAKLTNVQRQSSRVFILLSFDILIASVFVENVSLLWQQLERRHASPQLLPGMNETKTIFRISASTYKSAYAINLQQTFFYILIHHLQPSYATFVLKTQDPRDVCEMSEILQRGTFPGNYPGTCWLEVQHFPSRRRYKNNPNYEANI